MLHFQEEMPRIKQETPHFLLGIRVSHRDTETPSLATDEHRFSSIRTTLLCVLEPPAVIATVAAGGGKHGIRQR